MAKATPLTGTESAATETRSSFQRELARRSPWKKARHAKNKKLILISLLCHLRKANAAAELSLAASRCFRQAGSNPARCKTSRRSRASGTSLRADDAGAARQKGNTRSRSQRVGSTGRPPAARPAAKRPSPAAGPPRALPPAGERRRRRRATGKGSPRGRRGIRAGLPGRPQPPGAGRRRALRLPAPSRPSAPLRRTGPSGTGPAPGGDQPGTEEGGRSGASPQRSRPRRAACARLSRPVPAEGPREAGPPRPPGGGHGAGRAGGGGGSRGASLTRGAGCRDAPGFCLLPPFADRSAATNPGPRRKPRPRPMGPPVGGSRAAIGRPPGRGPPRAAAGGGLGPARAAPGRRAWERSPSAGGAAGEAGPGRAGAAATAPRSRAAGRGTGSAARLAPGRRHRPPGLVASTVRRGPSGRRSAGVVQALSGFLVSAAGRRSLCPRRLRCLCQRRGALGREPGLGRRRPAGAELGGGGGSAGAGARDGGRHSGSAQRWSAPATFLFYVCLITAKELPSPDTTFFLTRSAINSVR